MTTPTQRSTLRTLAIDGARLRFSATGGYEIVRHGCTPITVHPRTAESLITGGYLVRSQLLGTTERAWFIGDAGRDQVRGGGR